jgi:protein SCO1/2
MRKDQTPRIRNATAPRPVRRRRFSAGRVHVRAQNRDVQRYPRNYACFINRYIGTIVTKTGPSDNQRDLILPESIGTMRHVVNFIPLHCILVFAIFASPAPKVAAPERAPIANKLPSSLRDVGIDQKLNNQIPLDLLFRDESGADVRLGEYFGQKPVILALVYYDCPMLCTIVLNGLLHSLKELKLNVGQQFEVVTVSFDPTEAPALAAAKKAIYVGLYGRPGAAAGWHFLTGEESSIHRLTQAVGFRYNYDPQTKQYAHATGIMVVTPQGRLARYFYGIQYPSGNLRLGLVEASQGNIGSPVDELLLYCSQYDPGTGKYSVVISHVLKLGALLTILSLASLVLAMSRGGKRTTT